MFDDSSLLAIAVTIRHEAPARPLPAGPYGIGIKQGNMAMKRWVDPRSNACGRRTLPPDPEEHGAAAQVAPFSKNILRPKQTFGYNQGDITTVCS